MFKKWYNFNMAHKDPLGQNRRRNGTASIQSRISSAALGRSLADELIRERRQEVLQEEFGRDVPESCTIRVGARGRLVIPAKIRRGMKLRPGDELILIPQPDGSCRLISRRGAIQNARGMFAHVAPGRSLVQELLEERRREAAGDAKS